MCLDKRYDDADVTLRPVDVDPPVSLVHWPLIVMTVMGYRHAIPPTLLTESTMGADVDIDFDFINAEPAPLAPLKLIFRFSPLGLALTSIRCAFWGVLPIGIPKSTQFFSSLSFSPRQLKCHQCQLTTIYLSYSIFLPLLAFHPHLQLLEYRIQFQIAGLISYVKVLTKGK